MLALERRNLIVQRLNLEGKVIVSTLSREFGVSEETIRRDIEKLEQEGLATKTYGGAISTSSQNKDLPYKVPMGHSLIAIQSTLKGLRKLLLNREAIDKDLDDCWSVVAEAIQTILRREAYPHPYEALKALTRTNEAITETSIHDFIEGLNVSDNVKEELRAITPMNYTGI